jgi:hypothetical protein
MNKENPMRIIFATILSVLLLTYYLFRGKKGLREAKQTISGLTGTKGGKYFFAAVIVCFFSLIVMLFSGWITFEE